MNLYWKIWSLFAEALHLVKNSSLEKNIFIKSWYDIVLSAESNPFKPLRSFSGIWRNPDTSDGMPSVDHSELKVFLVNLTPSCLPCTLMLISIVQRFGNKWAFGHRSISKNTWHFEGCFKSVWTKHCAVDNCISVFSLLFFKWQELEYVTISRP